MTFPLGRDDARRKCTRTDTRVPPGNCLRLSPISGFFVGSTATTLPPELARIIEEGVNNHPEECVRRRVSDWILAKRKHRVHVSVLTMPRCVCERTTNRRGCPTESPRLPPWNPPGCS